jgi:hypothetical protein
VLSVVGSRSEMDRVVLGLGGEHCAQWELHYSIPGRYADWTSSCLLCFLYFVTDSLLGLSAIQMSFMNFLENDNEERGMHIIVLFHFEIHCYNCIFQAMSLFSLFRQPGNDSTYYEVPSD